MAKDKDLTTTSSVDLQAMVEQEKTDRSIIKKYVSDQLVSGVDYGIIVGKKPTLLKPGMEKIFSLMKITSALEKDSDTWEMLGSKAGMVCYKAVLYRDGDERPFAEGRGSATVGEKSRDANTTVKIAEKRARMDACLSLGFSEFFTQDLDDMDLPHDEPKATGLQAVYGAERPASQKQIDFVRSLMVTKGGVKSVADAHKLMESYGVPGKDPNTLTGTEAKVLIDALVKLKTTPATPDDFPVYDEADETAADKYDGGL